MQETLNTSTIDKKCELQGLLNSTGLNTISPFYHLVSDEVPAHISALYRPFMIREFRAHLDYLGKNFDFIDAEQLLERMEGGKKARPAVFLSFDDGLRECYSIVAPILIEKGIPATFFVNSGFIDNDRIFFRYKVSAIISALKLTKDTVTPDGEIREIFRGHGPHSDRFKSLLLSMKEDREVDINKLLRYLNINIRNSDVYMSSIQIKSLAEKGFHIGAHGEDHRQFSELGEEEQIRQVVEGITYCRDKFGQKLGLFAFPYHDFELKSSLYHKMFKDLGVDLSFGTSGIKLDLSPKSIQRLAMERDFAFIRTFLKGHLYLFGLKRLLGRHKMKR